MWVLAPVVDGSVSSEAWPDSFDLGSNGDVSDKRSLCAVMVPSKDVGY